MPRQLVWANCVDSPIIALLLSISICFGYISLKIKVLATKKSSPKKVEFQIYFCFYFQLFMWMFCFEAAQTQHGYEFHCLLYCTLLFALLFLILHIHGALLVVILHTSSTSKELLSMLTLVERKMCCWHQMYKHNNN